MTTEARSSAKEVLLMLGVGIIAMLLAKKVFKSETSVGPLAIGGEYFVGANGVIEGELRGWSASQEISEFRIVRAPSLGHLDLGEEGHFRYTPHGQQTKEFRDPFTFIAFDRYSVSRTAEIVIRFVKPEAGNHAPVGVSAVIEAASGTLARGFLTGFDVEGDSVSFRILEQPQHSYVTLDAQTGVFTLSSEAKAHGMDSFRFEVLDSRNSVSSPSTLWIHYTRSNENRSPVVQNSGFQLWKRGQFLGKMLAVDFDGDKLSYFISKYPLKGRLLRMGNRPEFIYVSSPQASGEDEFRFFAEDGSESSGEAVVKISFTPPRQVATISDPKYGEIEPILRANCYVCHSNALRAGGISLEGEENARLHANHLLEEVKIGAMPLGGIRLANEQISKLEHWAKAQKLEPINSK